GEAAVQCCTGLGVEDRVRRADARRDLCFPGESHRVAGHEELGAACGRGRERPELIDLRGSPRGRRIVQLHVADHVDLRGTADAAAWQLARRPKGCKLAAVPRLRTLVAEKLQQDWSPEQI